MKNKKIRFTIILLLLVSVLFTSCSINNKKEGEKAMNNFVQLTPLSIEEGYEIYPKSFDDSQYNNTDLLLQSAYLSVLNEYLEQEVALSKYQEDLNNSDFSFPYTNKTIYSKIGLFGRENISLRNTPFVNRLNDSQKKLLLSSINNDNEIEITDELLSLIEDTWREVITVKLESDDAGDYEIVYDLDAVETRNAMSNALTFELCYETEYDNNGNIQNEDYEQQKYEYSLALKMRMEKEISEKLNCPVTVFIKNQG